MTRPDQNFRRNNHYVPQFLLEQFAVKDHGERKQVWEYSLLVEDKRVPEWRLRDISALAKHSDLYTIATEVKDSDDLERWLDREFEEPACEAVRNAAEGKVLSKREWDSLVRLYAAQFVRTPAFFLRHKDRWAYEMNQIMEDSRKKLLEQLPRCQDPKEEIATFAVEDGFPLRYIIRRHDGLERSLHIQHVTGRKHWMWQIRGALAAAGPISRLHDLKWSILTFPPGVLIPLTDNPALCMRRRSDGSQSWNAGWTANGSVLMMPLGPERLLYCCVGSRLDKYVHVHPLLAKHLKASLVDASYRFYYSSTKDETLSTYRPRRIDQRLFLEEKRAWKAFGEEHGRAERFEN